MIKEILKKIPGFRTGSKWKMIIATIVYLFFIVIIINPSGATLRDKVIFILEFLMVFGITLVLVTNVGNIRSRLPIFNKKTIKSNILGGFIVLIIMSIGFSMLESLKSPEQKQLDLMAVQQSETKKVAKDLDEKIKALGDVNTLTLDKADNVKSIRKAYEALTTDQKVLVTKLDVLVSAEKKITNLQAEADKLAADKVALNKKSAADLDNKIKALGDVNTLTLDKSDNVKSIRTAYEALTTDQKVLITKLNILVSAEKIIANLQTEAEKKAAAEKVAAEKKAAAEKAAAEKKAAEKAAKEKAAKEYKQWIDDQFSGWDGSNIYLVKLVKENLNDPKSFEHVETVYQDKGTYIIVKMTYRAKNAFGGLILQNVTAKADYKSQTISIISQND